MRFFVPLVACVAVATIAVVKANSPPAPVEGDATTPISSVQAMKELVVTIAGSTDKSSLLFSQTDIDEESRHATLIHQLKTPLPMPADEGFIRAQKDLYLTSVCPNTSKTVAFDDGWFFVYVLKGFDGTPIVEIPISREICAPLIGRSREHN